LKRYTYASALGLTATEDDDGNLAAGNVAREDRKHRDPFSILVNMARSAESRDDGGEILAYYNQIAEALERERGTRRWQALDNALAGGIANSMGKTVAAIFISAFRANTAEQFQIVDAKLGGDWLETLAAVESDAPKTHAELTAHIKRNRARVMKTARKQGQEAPRQEEQQQQQQQGKPAQEERQEAAQDKPEQQQQQQAQPEDPVQAQDKPAEKAEPMPWDGMAFPVCDRPAPVKDAAGKPIPGRFHAPKCIDLKTPEDWAAELQTRVATIQKISTMDADKKRELIRAVRDAQLPVWKHMDQSGKSAHVTEAGTFFGKATGEIPANA
jgi:hypothetical protein